MRPWFLFALLALACEGSGGGPGKGGKGGDEDAKAPPDDRVLIEAAPAELGDVADFLDTTGTLESEEQADLVPEATGMVRQVLVEEGDLVRKGQVLAVLENPSLEAGANRATIELDRARQERDNARVLHAQGAISDRELTTAEQGLRTAETSYAEASGTRGFTRISSPIDGIVAVRDIRVGELAGARRVFQVVRLDRLRVVVNLPERDLSRVKLGQKVTLRSAYDTKATAPGEVARVSPVVDPATGTVRVTVTVDPNQTALRPGQFVRVGIELAQHENVVTIAREALVYDDGEPIAWRVEDAPPLEDKKDDEPEEEPPFWKSWFESEEAVAASETPEVPLYPRRVVERVPLVIGYVNDERVEVSEGLKAGDLVVTTGSATLREGANVRLPEDPAPIRKDEDEEEDKG